MASVLANTLTSAPWPLAVKLLARDLFEGGHGHGVGKHVDLGALAVELLGRDLVGDVGEEHVDLVKLLARVLVQGGHGHGVGEHGLLGRDLVEDVHEDVDLVKLLARAPCRRRT